MLDAASKQPKLFFTSIWLNAIFLSFAFSNLYIQLFLVVWLSDYNNWETKSNNNIKTKQNNMKSVWKPVSLDRSFCCWRSNGRTTKAQSSTRTTITATVTSNDINTLLLSGLISVSVLEAFCSRLPLAARLLVPPSLLARLLAAKLLSNYCWPMPIAVILCIVTA